MVSQSIPRIPRSVLVVIDDCGMRDAIGEVGPGGRFETVINRPLGAADYETLARIGREAGTRLQLAMILCYWDCEGVCAKAPTTTWMGADWKPETSRAWMEASAQVFADNPLHLEFAMHGVGHDYWIDGGPHVGEWADRETGKPWPREDLQRHIDCFMEIVAQTGLADRVPYRVPESFVPCYFRYYLDDGNPASTGHLMAENSIRYASTPFGGGLHMPSGEKPEADGVFDSGILLLDRDNTDVRWNQEATVPPRLPRTSICGMHWGNFLSADPEGNAEVADRWIAYLKGCRSRAGVDAGARRGALLVAVGGAYVRAGGAGGRRDGGRFVGCARAGVERGLRGGVHAGVGPARGAASGGVRE